MVLVLSLHHCHVQFQDVSIFLRKWLLPSGTSWTSLGQQQIRLGRTSLLRMMWWWFQRSSHYLPLNSRPVDKMVYDCVWEADANFLLLSMSCQTVWDQTSYLQLISSALAHGSSDNSNLIVLQALVNRPHMLLGIFARLMILMSSTSLT